MKLYTSIDQGERLIELGLNPNTADMCWTNHLYGDLMSSFRIEGMPQKEYEKILKSFHMDSAHFIPSWSCGRLLELLPKVINVQEDLFKNVPYGWEFHPNKSGRVYRLAYVRFGNVSKPEYKERVLYEVEGEDMMGVVYDAVCWLIKNGYFNKN